MLAVLTSNGLTVYSVWHWDVKQMKGNFRHHYLFTIELDINFVP